jgi:hypothetical protein
MRRGALLPALLLAVALPAGASLRASLADGRTALRVGDWSLSRPALALLERVARTRTPEASSATIAASVLEDHVIGEHARAAVGDDALFDNRFIALTPDAAAEASLDASIEAAWRTELAAALAPDGGARFIVRRQPLTRERLRALLGAGRQVRLDDRLSPERAAALDGVVLIEWRIDAQAAGRVTLGEVWRRLTVQERTMLYDGDAAYAMHAAEQRVRHVVVQHWVSAYAGLDEADLATLQALLADHDRRAAFVRWSGAVDEDHVQSAELERLRAAVSNEDIRRWYDAHPGDFKRTLRVHARHVRCADEAHCNAASAALAHGMPFADVARRWSIAPDAAQGGDLGWIDAARSREDWLAQLAFAQPVGPPTEPLHEPSADPDTGAWQIVEVLARVQGRHAADSEAVRFEAGQAIARERAIAGYAALRTRLLAEADVELDPALLGFGPDALAAAQAR